MTKKKHGSSIQKRLIPSYIFLVIVSFISVFPFFWMISAATNKSIDVARGRIAFGGYALENLKKLFASQNVALGMKNSLINATVQTIIALLVCSLAGYGFELYHDKAKDKLFSVLLLAMMIPQVLPRSQASQVSATRSLYLQFIPQWEWVFGLHPDHWNRFKVSVPTLYTSFIF